jgi:hypothetical protein
VVWVGFDTLQSTWPLRISFPIFFVNALDWLNPAATSASQFVVRSGEPVRISLPSQAQIAKVIRPGGESEDVEMTSDGREIVFGGTTRQGVYRVKAGTNDLPFCVNVMDAFESSTAPRDELPLGRYGTTVKAAGSVKANNEFWRWLAGAGLFVLMFEWWYYHKRTA